MATPRMFPMMQDYTGQTILARSDSSRRQPPILHLQSLRVHDVSVNLQFYSCRNCLYSKQAQSRKLTLYASPVVSENEKRFRCNTSTVGKVSNNVDFMVAVALVGFDEDVAVVEGPRSRPRYSRSTANNASRHCSKLTDSLELLLDATVWPISTLKQ
jgi:hypothetical protein